MDESINFIFEHSRDCATFAKARQRLMEPNVEADKVVTDALKELYEQNKKLREDLASALERATELPHFRIENETSYPVTVSIGLEGCIPTVRIR